MRACFIAISIVCAAIFTALYWQPPIIAPGISLEALTAFRGATPYQYRVLMPLLARGVLLVAPLPLVAVYAALTFAFTFGLFWAWRAYLQEYLKEATEVYALALLYSLIWNYIVVSGIRYPWDVPAIFFFVLGVVLIQRQQWRWYYLAFFLSCLNRETSCFLVLAFALLTWNRDKKWLFAHAASQSALWLGVKFSLTQWFTHNPGEKVFEDHFTPNLAFLTNVLRHPSESLDWMLLTFGWMALLILFSWRNVPRALKKLLLIVPPFLLGMMIAGDFGQARIHNELVPLLLAPALCVIEAWRLSFRKDRHAR